MNEISLSNDLNVITAEINSYKQVAGQSIFEIGKRLKHVKENDLVHGEFGKWLESIEMNHSTANKFMKVYSELGSKSDTYPKLSFNALIQIATMPEQEREQKHKIPSTGEQKTVDEMTVKELREVKKQLKQEQQAREQAEQTNKKLGQLLTEERNKQPEVIEKEIVKEVVPENLKQKMKEQERIYKATVRDYEKIQDELDLLKKQKTYSDNQEKEEKELKALELEANKTVLTTKIKIDEFLKDVAITAFRRGAIASSSDGTKQKLSQGVDELKNFIKEMEMALNGRIEA